MHIPSFYHELLMLMSSLQLMLLSPLQESGTGCYTIRSAIVTKMHSLLPDPANPWAPFLCWSQWRTSKWYILVMHLWTFLVLKIGEIKLDYFYQPSRDDFAIVLIYFNYPWTDWSLNSQLVSFWLMYTIWQLNKKINFIMANIKIPSMKQS